MRNILDIRNIITILTSSYYQEVNSFLVLFLVILVTFVVSYIVLFAIWQGTFKSDWYTLYNINVAVAKKFNELRLLVAVVFSHPPGPKWRGGQEKAQPLKLIFTDQSKVSTSAGEKYWEIPGNSFLSLTLSGAENSVVQIIGSLYDSLETTYGTLATRLYRAFRPRPLKSSSPSVLRRVCCVPSAYLYIFR